MITESMQKFGITDEEKYYSLIKLWEVLYDIGITRMKRTSFTQDWFLRKMRKGSIVLPFEKNTYLWKLTKSQIEGIVRAFVPGGSGKYDYHNE